MASLRKRNGKWQARVVRKGQPPIARSFINKSDAEKWTRNTEVSIERGTFRVSLGVTLRDLVQRYSKEITPTKKNARSERFILNAWAKDALSTKSADAVKPADLARWRDARLTRGAANGTVRNAMAALSAVYRHAASEWGYDNLQNPLSTIKRPSPAKARARRVAQAEIDAIKPHTDSPALPFIIDLAVETAMRQGEIVRLTWQHIDLSKRTAHLPDIKNGEARTVPLSTRAVAVLAEWKKHVKVQSIDGQVFSVTPHVVAIAFRRAVKRARTGYVKDCKKRRQEADMTFLVGLRFHDLRPEAVSRLFERGLNMMEVAAISGHKTLQMLKRYTHLTPETLLTKLG